MLQNVIQVGQIVTAISLIILILLQSKGGGLGSAFGGTGSYSTRRGIEVVVFRLTIILAVVFFGISAARLFL